MGSNGGSIDQSITFKVHGEPAEVSWDCMGLHAVCARWRRCLHTLRCILSQLPTARHMHRLPCCSNYEHLFSDTLPHEASHVHIDPEQARLQERIRRVITVPQQQQQQQQQLGRLRSGATEELQRAIAGKLAEARKPSRLVNAVSTMPGVKASQAFVRRTSDENEVPRGSRRQTPPGLQLPAAMQQQQQQDDAARPGTRLFRPQEATRSSISHETPRQPVGSWHGGGGGGHSGMPGSPGRSQTSRGTGLGGAAPMHPVHQRQIELRAAMRPPSAEPPHKSPWRPPGGWGVDEGVCTSPADFFACLPPFIDRCHVPPSVPSPVPCCRQEREGDGLQEASPGVVLHRAAVPPRVRLSG